MPQVLKRKTIHVEKGNRVIPHIVTLSYNFYTYTVDIDGEVWKTTSNELFAVQSFNAI